MDYSTIQNTELIYDPIYGDVLMIDQDGWGNAYDNFMPEFKENQDVTAAALTIQMWWLKVIANA